MEEGRIRPEDVTRASEEVRAHEDRVALGALAFDVLSRQAEGRALFAGREYVQARAEEHGVEREAASIEGGNLLAILERGPASARERAAVAAFAVAGLCDRFDEAGRNEQGTLVARFVRHADWLEAATPFVVYAFVPPIAPDELARAVWDAVCGAVLADASAEPAAASRSRNAVRLTALAAGADAAEDARARVLEQAADPATRALAAALFGERRAGSEAPLPAGETVRIAGRMGWGLTTSGRTALRWLTGIALLQWLGRGLAFICGLRRAAELELTNDGLRVHRKIHLFGKLVREGRETYTLKAVAGAGRLARYPALHLVVGAVAMAAGVLFGGLLVFDAAWSGETVLLLVAAGLVLGGAGLDLALQVLVPAHRGSVAFELRVLPKRLVRLARVRRQDADRFIDALERRLG